MSPTPQRPSLPEPELEEHVLKPAKKRLESSEEAEKRPVGGPEVGSEQQNAPSEAFMSPRERPVCEG